MDVIDNEGRVKFIEEQLMPAGGLKLLFNLKGDTYRIQEIIGQFSKDERSKEILL